MTIRTPEARLVAAPRLAFIRVAGVGGVIAGLSSILYAVFFLLVKGPLHIYAPPIFLALGSLCALPLSVHLYRRVASVEADYAVLALLLAVVGYLGAAVHAVYDLGSLYPASAAQPTTSLSEIDPRGFLAFALTGLAALIFSWLIAHGRLFPPAVLYAGFALAIATIALFVANLVTGSSTHSPLVLVPGAIASLLAAPAWFVGLGFELLKERSEPLSAKSGAQ